MRKSGKMLASIALAGAMCLGTFGLTACGDPKEIEVPGKSAYEIAVENGFTGTEDEWLESLKVTVPTTVKDKSVSYSVNEDGKTVMTVTFTMSDDTEQTEEIVLPKRIISARLYGNGVIMTATEAAQKSNLTGIVWQIHYDDGSSGAIPADKSQIVEMREYSDTYGGDPETQWDGTFENGKVYEMTLCFGKYWDETANISVYVCNDVSTIADCKVNEEQLNLSVHVMQKGEAFDVKTMSIAQEYNLYDKLSGTYQGGYYGSGQFFRHKAVTDAMLSAPVDTSTVGDKNYTVTDNGKEYDGSLEVYDPAVSVVRYMSFESYEGTDNPYNVKITEGGNLTEIVESYVGKKMTVDYYVSLNGRGRETITLTSDMIDASGVDVNKAGNYKMKINYKGYSEDIYVTVNPDMTSATKTKTITGNGSSILSLMEGPIVSKADLYDNGYAVIYGKEDVLEPEIELTSMVGYLSYTVTGDNIEFGYNGENIAIFKVNSDNTFEAYEPLASDLVKTYTISVPDMGTLTVKAYNNGYAEVINGPDSVVVGYKTEGDTFYILPSEMIPSFTIGANDTLIPNN